MDHQFFLSHPKDQVLSKIPGSAYETNAKIVKVTICPLQENVHFG
jgi:hypothetical protein